MDAHVVERIAAEPIEALEERARTQAQIAALEDVIRTCRRHATHGNGTAPEYWHYFRNVTPKTDRLLAFRAPAQSSTSRGQTSIQERGSLQGFAQYSRPDQSIQSFATVGGNREV